MKPALMPDDVSARLIAFIREKFLAGDPQGELTDSSPLLEWGILNSLNTALLINFIREEFKTSVGLEAVDAASFGTVKSIAAMLCDEAAEG